MDWSARGVSYTFLQVDVPSACTVSISVNVQASGGYYTEGVPFVWYQGELLTDPYSGTITSTEDITNAHVVGSFEPPEIYTGPGSADVWAVVWGNSNGFSKEEYRSTTNSPYSSQYGTSTADSYYVEVDANIYGDAQGHSSIQIDW